MSTIKTTHWEQAARDYGWPHDFGLVAELWVPHGQDAPQAWFERFMDTSRQEATQRAMRGQR